MVRDEPKTAAGSTGETRLVELPGPPDDTVASTLTVRPPAGGVSGGAAPTEPAGTTDDPSAAAEFQIGRQIHAALRGRYTLVVLLGVLTGLALGAAAWQQTRPSYTSEGLLRIAYSRPQVREETDQNQPLPFFENFMLSQKTLMISHRVLDMAAHDDAWKAVGGRAPPNREEYLADNLKVDTKPRSELISLTLTDADPGVAAAAVTAVIHAYANLYDSSDQKLAEQRLSLLEERQRTLTAQIQQLAAQMRERAGQYGTTKLDATYDALALRRNKLQDALTDINLALANATTQPGGSTAPYEPATAPTAEQIAAIDPVMRSYWDEQVRLQSELDRLLLTYGKAHHSVIIARQQLESATLRVRQYAQLYSQSHRADQPNAEPGAHVSLAAGRSVEELRSSAENLTQLLAQARQDLVTLGNTRQDLEQMQTKRDALQTELTALNRRLEVLRAEGAMGSRLSIISAGEVSLAPKSKHRTAIVGAAALGGTGFPAGIVLLVSLVRRRYRYSDEAAHDTARQHIPLLGLLPEIQGRRPVSDQSMAAAYGVHHLRVLLSNRAAPHGAHRYLITSATAGDGKTSLTAALALSFAAAHQRTLVIDGDFVGRRLTQGFNVQGHEGLLEAMETGRLQNKVLPLVPYLFILPAGQASAADACQLTARRIRGLLEEARREFDIVLIDTGPILGSLEAAVLAHEVDGVILTIARGQPAPLAAQAVRRLSTLEARCAGVVFNRAKLQDFQCSASTVSSVPPPGPAPRTSRTTKLAQSVMGFGPLVRAVAATMPAN